MAKPGIVFIGMETSGRLRRAFQARGFETFSCDLRPSQDGGEEMAYSPDNLPLGRHLVGDVFETLEGLRANDLWPSLAIFHPDCTYLANSGAWAFADPDYDRWPGVGYHQRVRPGTLTGAARRAARMEAIATVRRIMELPIRLKAIENPRGGISSRLRTPDQAIQPHQFGDDASKETCLWLHNLPLLTPTRSIPARVVDGRLRWANQTDKGQNRLSPAPDRAMRRADTYPGIADAMADQWGQALIESMEGRGWL